jgi:hypothetical protein
VNPQLSEHSPRHWKYRQKFELNLNTSGDVPRVRPGPWTLEAWPGKTQYDRLVPQCLVIAPSYADLSALRTVLAELSITPTATTQLLVGAQLATVPLDEFSFAVAVLPASGPDDIPAMTPAAIFLEAGIVLGRGLPLIVLAEDTDEHLPVLGGLASDVWTIAGAKDEASIRLHLTLFTKVLEIYRSARDSVPRWEPSATSSVTPPNETIGRRGHSLQEEVLDLLQAGGAKVESETVSSSGDRVDAVALIPGTEHVLGPVLIEVKALQGHGLSAAVNQLAAFLIRSGAVLGLVVYDGPRQVLGPTSSFPVVAMHIDELREQVRRGSLGSTLVYIRNAAAHGLMR